MPSITDKDIEWIRQRISQGASPEVLLRQRPDLAETPLTAVELLYEYWSIRRERGEPVSAGELQERFPQFATKLAVVLECDRILTQVEEIQFPEPGERFGDFVVERELGRGATGRVFLATQPQLSDRPVVLKICGRSGDEHLSLARLQHTAIVPLLLANDPEGSPVRTICMPYLGACTLEMAMHSMVEKPVAQRSGKDLSDAIQRYFVPSYDELVRNDNPALRFLAASSYEKSVCWIIACLADGLHYAHQRGLVHLDVKPSNILLASDGQPMLLDFHLARDQSELQSDSMDSLGGTPGYMAPEHRAALHAIRQHKKAIPFDHRCDIYSLGLVMYDLLAGAPPLPVDTVGESPLRRPFDRHSASMLGTKKVVHLLQRALADDPGQRFEDASEFAHRLRAVAADTAKSTSRWPAFLAGATIGGAATLVAAMATGNFVGSQSAEIQVVTAPRVVDELHSLVVQARVNRVLETEDRERLVRLHHSCESLWAHRNALLKSVGTSTDDPAANRLKHDLHDLAMLYQELTWRLASPETLAVAADKASQIADEARELGLSEYPDHVHRQGGFKSGAE